MLKKNIKAPKKFNIDIGLIEKKVDIQKNIEVLGNDLTFIGSENTREPNMSTDYIPILVSLFPNW